MRWKLPRAVRPLKLVFTRCEVESKEPCSGETQQHAKLQAGKGLAGGRPVGLEHSPAAQRWVVQGAALPPGGSEGPWSALLPDAGKRAWTSRGMDEDGGRWHLAWTAGWMPDRGQKLMGQEGWTPVLKVKDVVGRAVDDCLSFSLCWLSFPWEDPRGSDCSPFTLPVIRRDVSLRS